MALYCAGNVVNAHRKELGKLSCGKGCIRFRKLDELPLDVVAGMLRKSARKR
jgi:hypothetical protein